MIKASSLIFIVICLSATYYAQVNVSGYVFDDKTGEKLPNAIIIINNSDSHIADSTGFFSFGLAQGKYLFEVRALGYLSKSQQISLYKDKGNKSLFFKLTPKPILISSVTVTGERYIKEINTTTFELQPGELSKIPQVGEPDVFRSIQALPGVTAINDLSSLIFLRGGNFDETLISVDNVSLFNPYHLGEMFSIINPDIIQLARLYTSNYPSNYGGYLSGILDLKSKTNYKFSGSVSLSILSLKLYASIPVLKGSLIIGARRAYFDLITNITGTAFPYYFYDLYGKYALPIDDNNLFEFSFLYTKDLYDIFSGEEYQRINDGNNPSWGNLLFSSKYFHSFNENDFVDVSIYSTNSTIEADAEAMYLYNEGDLSSNDAGIDSINSLFIDNYIKEYGLKSSLNIKFQGHSFLTGLEIKNMSLKNAWDIKENDLSGLLKYPLEEVFFDFAPNPYSSKDETWDYSYYLLDKIQLNKKIELTPGFRTSYVTKLNNIFFEPFILLFYTINEKVSLKLSYGSYYQYFYTIKDQQHQELYAPFSSYFLANDKNEVGLSTHFTLGLRVVDLLPGIDLNLEPYYKLRKNLPSSYKIDRSYRFEDGYAAGVDILLKKERGEFYGWISYSLSRTVKKNDDYTYYANYDRTHNLKILINFQPWDNWTISGFWTFSSGLPATPVIGKYLRGNDNLNNNHGFPTTVDYEGRVWNIIEGRKNSTRLSDYSRLDLGITGSFLWNKIIIKPYLQILNVYNSFNPYFYSAKVSDTSLEDGEKRGSYVIPTIGVSIDF